MNESIMISFNDHVPAKNCKIFKKNKRKKRMILQLYKKNNP